MCGIQPLPDDYTGQTRRFRCACRPTVGMPAGTVKPGWQLATVRVLERRLGAVLHPELREEMLHVELHRVVGQAEPLGDLRVGESAGHQRPDLSLARGEVAGRARPAFDPAARGLREHELARVHLPN